MNCVYILHSKKHHKFYIGSTNNLRKRIMEHNSGNGGIFTKINGPWRLIYHKSCDSLDKARKEEKRVKSFKGGEAFKKIINGEVAEWLKAPVC